MGRGLTCRGNVVHAAGRPRVAPAEPTNGEPGAAQRPVAPDGDHRVLRAARVVLAARRREGRDEPLVYPQQSEQRPPRQPDQKHAGRPDPCGQRAEHDTCRAHSSRRAIGGKDRHRHAARAHDDARARGPVPRRAPRVGSAPRATAVGSAEVKSDMSCPYVAAADGGRARTTTSAPSGSIARDSITTPRSLRRTLLRTTAPPTDRATTMPTCVPARSGTGRQCTTSVVRPARAPRRTVASKSADRRIRSAAGSKIRRTARNGPCAGVPRGWPGPRGCAFAGGSRASWLGAGCSAGRCASTRQTPLGSDQVTATVADSCASPDVVPLPRVATRTLAEHRSATRARQQEPSGNGCATVRGGMPKGQTSGTPPATPINPPECTRTADPPRRHSEHHVGRHH